MRQVHGLPVVTVFTGRSGTQLHGTTTESIDRQAGTTQGSPLVAVGVQPGGSSVSVIVGHVEGTVIVWTPFELDVVGGRVSVVGQGSKTVRYSVRAQSPLEHASGQPQLRVMVSCVTVAEQPQGTVMVERRAHSDGMAQVEQTAVDVTVGQELL